MIELKSEQAGLGKAVEAVSGGIGGGASDYYVVEQVDIHCFWRLRATGG